MPLPIAQPRSVRLGRGWRGRRFGRGAVQAPGLARPVLPRQQYRRRSLWASAAADADATAPAVPSPPPLPCAERAAAPRPLAQVLRPPAAGPARLRSLSYPAASEGGARRPPQPPLQPWLHYPSAALAPLPGHAHYPARTLPLPAGGGAAGWRRQAAADHLALYAPPARAHTLSQPRRARTLPAEPLPLRLALHPLHLRHAPSPDALSSPRQPDAPATLRSPVPSPLLHPATPSALTLATPVGCPALPAPRGRGRPRGGAQVEASQPDQHGRVKRRKSRALIRYHRGAVARGSRRSGRRAGGGSGGGGGGQVQASQSGQLARRRVLRAGRRKLLSLCYFHIHFPRR